MGILMNTRIIVMRVSLLAVLILMLIPTVLCGEFSQINWNPETSQATVSLDYPIEAHRGDTIKYKIDITWKNPLLVNYFYFFINYLREDGTWITLWSENLLTDVTVTANDPKTYTFDVEIPPTTALSDNALQAKIDIKVNNSDMSDLLSVYTTHVVKKTTAELQSEINSLYDNNAAFIDDYNSLSLAFEQYKQSHSYTNEEYESALSTQSQKTPLQTDSSELSLYRTTTYIATPIAIALFVLAVYFAKRKKS